MIANADAYASAPVGRWLLSLDTGMSWTNGQYIRSFFGMDDGQNARSGLLIFAMHAGLRNIHFNAIITCRLDDRWIANGSLTVVWLRSDAADSLATQRRQQTTAMASLTYRFH